MATRANAAYGGKDEARARMKSRLRRRAIVLYVSSVLIALATSLLHRNKRRVCLVDEVLYGYL